MNSFVHLLLLLLFLPWAAVAFLLVHHQETNNRKGTSSLAASASVQQQTCDVAVFGGGFGGLYTALAISGKARKQGKRVDVALVDPHDQFVFLPLLYDLTEGTATPAEVCPSYQDILAGTGVRHLKGTFHDFLNADMYSANVTLPNSGIESGEIALSFRSSVVSVGATPGSVLAAIPGATDYAQPFYTQKDAEDTRTLLNNLESQISRGTKPKVAIVGGGYGGVELSACVKRRLREADVTLVTRGPPMTGTRAEPLINKALKKLGVTVEMSTVQEIRPSRDHETDNRIVIERKPYGDDTTTMCELDNETPWDAVLWTAGSNPAYPVVEAIDGLKHSDAGGRLVVDSTLRCVRENDNDINSRSNRPPVWSLGDCSEIQDAVDSTAVPRTAQAAMQQADVVAANVLVECLRGKSRQKEVKFQFQDLGSMLTLGGPNAALLAPKEDSPLSPLFAPLLDTARVGLGLADELLQQVGQSPFVENSRAGEVVETLGLSLGGYGLGVDNESAPGTISGTLTGAARRAIYAARMPTNRQRVTAVASAAISTAATLAKQASEQLNEDNNNINNSNNSKQ